MAESSASASPAVAHERDVLLATKLHVPGLPAGLVARPRLIQRLDEGLGRGLVLVCAPAGYGKTVLLASWAQRARPAAAWLSLDAGDNDPAQRGASGRRYVHLFGRRDACPCPRQKDRSGPPPRGEPPGHGSRR